MSDNIYKVELDGKVYTVQSDHEPTEEDILGSIAHEARVQSQDAPGQYLGQMVGNIPSDLVAQGKGAVDLVKTLAGATGEAGNAIGSHINEAVFGPNARYQRQGPLQSGSQTSAADRQRELGKPDRPTPNMDALGGVVPGIVQHYKDYLDDDKRAQMVRDHPVGVFLDLAGGVEGIKGGARAAPGVIKAVPKVTGAVARAIPPELVAPVAATYGAYTRGAPGFIEGLAGGSVLDRMLERARGLGVTKRAAGPLSFEERFPTPSVLGPNAPPWEPSEGLAATLAKAQADAAPPPPPPPTPPAPWGEWEGWAEPPPAPPAPGVQNRFYRPVDKNPGGRLVRNPEPRPAPVPPPDVAGPATLRGMLNETAARDTDATGQFSLPPDWEARVARVDAAEKAAAKAAQTPAAAAPTPAAGPATSAATQADLMNELAARRSAAAQKGWATRNAAAAAAQTPAPAAPAPSSPPPMQPVPSHVPTTPVEVRPDYLGQDVTSPTAIRHDITQGNGGSIYEAGESYVQLGRRIDELMKNPTPANVEEVVKLSRMRRQRVHITEEREAAAAKAAQNKK